jgi:hypothetical protein
MSKMILRNLAVVLLLSAGSYIVAAQPISVSPLVIKCTCSPDPGHSCSCNNYGYTCSCTQK